MSTSLAALLAHNGLRVTKPRQRVFETLQTSETPLTIGEIARRCTDIDRTTIYRVIDKFCDLHIVTIVTVGWKHHYELAEPFVPHHHHLFCTHCRNAQPIQDDQLESFIQQLSTKYNFVATKHHFELEGICAHCRYRKK